jgi:hypothetical protein
MTGPLATAYTVELARAGDAALPMPQRWRAIERAHILPQPTLALAPHPRRDVAPGDPRPRPLRSPRPDHPLIAAGPASAADKHPSGNTARAIRRRYADGEVSLADLAEEYSVGRSTIHRIIHRPEPDNAAQQAAL